MEEEATPGLDPLQQSRLSSGVLMVLWIHQQRLRGEPLACIPELRLSVGCWLTPQEGREQPRCTRTPGHFTISDLIPWRVAPPPPTVSRFLLSEALVISKF